MLFIYSIPMRNQINNFMLLHQIADNINDTGLPQTVKILMWAREDTDHVMFDDWYNLF